MKSKEIRKSFMIWNGKSIVIIYFLSWFVTCMPTHLFDVPNSTILVNEKGTILAAQLADDGQWRFASTEEISPKVKRCLIEFEDRTFYQHIGVSIRGIARAFWDNVRSGRVASGGSTISMQVVRLSRKNPPRTYWEKATEIFRALQLELRYSKDEILNMYLNHAPYGGNIVGVEAASWRYFGRHAKELSWAESAMLSVLPNSPGLIFPGKNQHKLRLKRNRLLKHLQKQNWIKSDESELAQLEVLPQKSNPFPKLAQALLINELKKGKKGQRIICTLEKEKQFLAERLVELHARNWEEKGIHHTAVLISSIKTGKTLVYIGNTNHATKEYDSQVDCSNAPRSSGSILKPILFAASIDDGMILPKQVLPDIPFQFGSYSPKNFSGNFEGLIPADQALSRSLNVPMVHLLNQYGQPKFLDLLRKLGIKTMRKPARHYGLTLILGGAETKLNELHQMYLLLAQQSAGITEKKQGYLAQEMQVSRQPIPLSDAALFEMNQALIEVNRPNEENQWKQFQSSQKIAWKTGTSFGFRDAWSIGWTKEYIISVWVGNASGEGRPGLTGTQIAAPLMFDLFQLFPKSTDWFSKPSNEYTSQTVCNESGFPANHLCENVTNLSIPKRTWKQGECPYHQSIFVTKDKKYRLKQTCASIYDMQASTYFVLPISVAQIYKQKHPTFQEVPPLHPDCMKSESNPLLLIHPKPNAHLFLPRNQYGEQSKMVFEVQNRRSDGKIFWHLDERYLGETTGVHQLSVSVSEGKHQIKAMDESGNEVQTSFFIVSKRNVK